MFLTVFLPHNHLPQIPVVSHDVIRHRGVGDGIIRKTSHPPNPILQLEMGGWLILCHKNQLIGGANEAYGSTHRTVTRVISVEAVAAKTYEVSVGTIAV